MDGNKEITAIPRERVAEITTWKNNCALSCTATFLVDALLSKRLTPNAERKLLEYFCNYYGVKLSVEQLRDIFARVITHPSDRQIVLGTILREFINTEGEQGETDREAEIVRHEENMLSNDDFRPLARAFDFNVDFYADLEGKIKSSGTIPSIIIDPSFITLRPYYHNKHFDLIVDDEGSAAIHNQASFESSPLELPIEVGKEEVLRTRIKKLVGNQYNNTEHERSIMAQVETLFQLADSLSEEDSYREEEETTLTEQITLLASDIKKRSDDFFQQSIPERSATIDKFKQDIRELIRKYSPALSWYDRASSYLFTLPKQQLKDILTKIDREITLLTSDLRPEESNEVVPSFSATPR